MSIIDKKFKVKKVIVDGQKKFVPIQKTTIFGLGWWVVPKDWEEIEKRIEGERALIVGIGKVPEEDEVDDTWFSSPEHIEYFQTKLARGLRYPKDKDDPIQANPYYTQ